MLFQINPSTQLQQDRLSETEKEGLPKRWMIFLQIITLLIAVFFASVLFRERKRAKNSLHQATLFRNRINDNVQFYLQYITYVLYYPPSEASCSNKQTEIF